MKKYIIILSFFTSLIFTFSLNSAYELKSDVLSSGGAKMSSSGYIAKGTISQMTVSRPWLISSSYKAIIGFWHPGYAVSIDETSSPPPTIVLRNFLCQNSPNPVSKTTTINYSLAQKGNVSLEVFNAIGQRVITLVGEEQKSGFYKVVWDIRNTSGTTVPAGVYFYHLTTNNYKKIRKMIILR